MRWLLVLTLVTGLVPDAASAIQAAARAGVEQLASFTGLEGGGGHEDERDAHGCGACHDCSASCCCNVAAPPRRLLAVRAAGGPLGRPDRAREVRVSREPSRPFRPPIV